MLFVTINDDVKQRAIEYINSLEGSYDIEITKHRKSRSLSQNRLMWMWYKIIGDYMGETPEDLHDICKVSFLGVEKKNKMGLLWDSPKSSTVLNTKEFTEFLDKIDALAISLGLTLPKPAGIYDEAYGIK